MPEEFDPAWEYFVAEDPDVDFLSESPPEAWGFAERDAENHGCRRGTGSPDKYLPPEPPAVRVVDRHERAPRECVTCRTLFIVRRPSQSHCGRGCVKKGRDRELADIDCETCGARFRPPYRGRRFCSRACIRASPPPPNPEMTVFARGYLSGAAMSELALLCGVSVVQLKRWRRKLGLPPRPAGNKSRSKSVDSA